MTKHAPPGVQFHFGRLLVTLRMMVASFEAVTSRLCEKMTFLTPKVVVFTNSQGIKMLDPANPPFHSRLPLLQIVSPPHEC